MLGRGGREGGDVFEGSFSEPSDERQHEPYERWTLTRDEDARNAAEPGGIPPIRDQYPPVSPGKTLFAWIGGVFFRLKTSSCSEVGGRRDNLGAGVFFLSGVGLDRVLHTVLLKLKVVELRLIVFTFNKVVRLRFLDV